MKKNILVLIFCFGLMCSPAFAEDDSSNAHIAHTLCMIFNMNNENYFADANEYRETNLVYNGITVTAFKSKTSGWVGFFKNLSVNNLPENALSNINNEFKSCSIKDVIMFFNNETDIYYFAKVIENNKCIVLKIQPSGKVTVFNDMSSNVTVSEKK